MIGNMSKHVIIQATQMGRYLGVWELTYLGCLILSDFDGDIKQQNADDGTWMVLDEAVRGGGTCAMDDWVGAPGILRGILNGNTGCANSHQ